VGEKVLVSQETNKRERREREREKERETSWPYWMDFIMA
jgi:hypothetical protein